MIVYRYICSKCDVEFFSSNKSCNFCPRCKDYCNINHGIEYEIKPTPAIPKIWKEMLYEKEINQLISKEEIEKQKIELRTELEKDKNLEWLNTLVDYLRCYVRADVFEKLSKDNKLELKGDKIDIKEIGGLPKIQNSFDSDVRYKMAEKIEKLAKLVNKL